MTDQQHPITPPPELLGKWEEDWHHAKVKHIELEDHIATQAARWGADQELKACCEWLVVDRWESIAGDLRAARRPKPPSLKDQALKALDNISIASFEQDAANTIRYALEQLDD